MHPAIEIYLEHTVQPQGLLTNKPHLNKRPHRLLHNKDGEDHDTLQSVDDVEHRPHGDSFRAGAHGPGDHLHDPGEAHDDGQHAAGAETGRAEGDFEVKGLEVMGQNVIYNYGLGVVCLDVVTDRSEGELDIKWATADG